MGLRTGRGGTEVKKTRNIRNGRGCFPGRENSGEGLQLREHGLPSVSVQAYPLEERGAVSPGALIQWVWVGSASLHF